MSLKNEQLWCVLIGEKKVYVPTLAPSMLIAGIQSRFKSGKSSERLLALNVQRIDVVNELPADAEVWCKTELPNYASKSTCKASHSIQAGTQHKPPSQRSCQSAYKAPQARAEADGYLHLEKRLEAPCRGSQGATGAQLAPKSPVKVKPPSKAQLKKQEIQARKEAKLAEQRENLRRKNAQRKVVKHVIMPVTNQKVEQVLGCAGELELTEVR